MGNQNSIPDSNTTSENSSSKLNHESKIHENDAIFDNILEMSKELLQKYNENLLKEDFCFHMGFVIENELSKMDIIALRDMSNKIENSTNKESENDSLRVILQYDPSEEEKFFIDGFEKQLQDYFWNQSLRFNQSIIQKEGIQTNDIPMSQYPIFKDKNKFRYIDITKVNDLLKDSQFTKHSSQNKSQKHKNKLIQSQNIENSNSNQNTNQNSNQNINENTNTNENKQSGGLNQNQYRRNLEIEFQENKKINNKKNKNQKQQSPSQNQNMSLSKRKIEIVNNNIENLINTNKNKENIQKLRLALSNVSNKNNKKTNQMNQTLQNIVSNQSTNQVSNENIGMVLQKINNEINRQNKKMKQNQNQNSTVSRKELTSVIQNMVRNSVTNQKNKNKINKNKNKNTSSTIQMNQTQTPLSTTNTNKTNTNKTNKTTINQNQNKYIQYKEMKNKYGGPEKFCLEGVEKCSLSKKQFCKVIRDNLIIRMNIIAAILTVLPNRKIRGKYVGGYLYSKFVNLGKCQVCVPYNYKQLLDLPPSQLIKHVVHYSDFIDPKSCKENGGYYLKLSKSEMEALYHNVPENNTGKQTNYNSFYIQCAEKLKTTYFDNLKVLLEILQELKNKPIISNQVLNEIGQKTKQIIDTMYHLCQYYYIYAIISLLHANLSIPKPSDLQLQKTISSALQPQPQENSSP